jgi:hypothetical protein
MTEYTEQLPCGAELESLLVQVADHEPGTDPEHQASCPYCQAALESLGREWSGATARTMLAIRELAVLLADSTLIEGPRGETRVSHIAVARVAQRLAAGVPGVVFASAKPVPQEPPHPVRLSIAVRLVVGWNPAITQIARALRDLLIRRVPALTGAELTRIDISIRDIAEPGD